MSKDDRRISSVTYRPYFPKNIEKLNALYQQKRPDNQMLPVLGRQGETQSVSYIGNGVLRSDSGYLWFQAHGYIATTEKLFFFVAYPWIKNEEMDLSIAFLAPQGINITPLHTTAYQLMLAFKDFQGAPGKQNS